MEIRLNCQEIIQMLSKIYFQKNLHIIIDLVTMNICYKILHAILE